MEQWRKDARKETIIIDMDSLVPANHLLRKIEKVMDFEWLYERLDPYYNHNNGRWVARWNFELNGAPMRVK